MDPTPCSAKRKRGEEHSPLDLSSIGTDPEVTEVVLLSKTEEAAQSLAEVVEFSGIDFVPTAAVLVACQAALVGSSVASRAVLAKYRSIIDMPLTTLLELVGGYTEEEGNYTLHESLRRGDATTAQYLIAAGADLNAKGRGGTTLHDVNTDHTCLVVLEHHNFILEALRADPTALVSTALAHCATLSAPDEPVPATTLVLHPSFLDPSFQWVPKAARREVSTWARNAVIVQLAASVQPFSELPDDCAGDVLEFLELDMAREESLHIVTNCSSPEACIWVRMILSSVIAEKILSKLGPAVEEGDLATVKYCLATGVDVDLWIMMCGTTREDGTTPLVFASLYGHAEIVEMLLLAGADVEVKDANGFQALHWASMEGHKAVVKLLLIAGANVDARNAMPPSCLMYASGEGQSDAVEILLQPGADINAKNEYGHSALFHALDKGYDDNIVKLLLEKGADIETKDRDGCTALIYASRAKTHDDVVNIKLLLEAGADIEAVDKEGSTALHRASRLENLPVLELLLIAGVNKDAQDNLGRTALHLAVDNLSIDVTRLLALAGANYKIKSNDNISVLEWAERRGDKMLIDLFQRQSRSPASWREIYVALDQPYD